MSNFQIKTENPNYLAKIVKLSAGRKHPNADKLQIFNIDGNNVITGLDAKESDIYIYFPLECAINKEYLSWSNSFSSPELNADKTKKGFFPNTGRVKAVRLRSQPSEGYIVPISNLAEWLKIDIDEFKVGTEFSHYGDILICEKYVVKKSFDTSDNKNKHGKIKRESRLVDNQFRLHVDTANLKRFINDISPEDFISISYKIHGTSFVAGKILCKKPLKLYERILKKIGVQIIDSQYDLVFSSRRVIKNAYADQKTQDFYDTDIWGLVAKKLEPSIKNGISLYGEIFGQTPTGQWIQSMFDYGTAPNQHDYAIYRITYTSPSGDVIEFTEGQLIEYCKKYGLNTVPYFYRGKAKDVFPELSITEHWHENILEKLKEKYTEKNCYMCKNVRPEEGVVIRVESDTFKAYKLKSFKFLELETKELDKGEENIEDSN